MSSRRHGACCARAGGSWSLTRSSRPGCGVAWRTRRCGGPSRSSPMSSPRPRPRQCAISPPASARPASPTARSAGWAAPASGWSSRCLLMTRGSVMSWRDWLAEVLETGFRLVPIRARTGVRAVGRPDRSSPVLLTGNYDLTVRRVLRALRGLEARVAHRQVIVPQLAATGIEAKEVRRRTGWIVRFGPVDVVDVPAYLAANHEKTEAMRVVRFGLRQRLEMAAAWATPISLGALPIGWRHPGAALVLVWALALAVFLGYDQLPFGERLRQAVAGVVATAGVLGALAVCGTLTTAAVLGWGTAALGCVGLLTFDLAGSTPTAPAGLFEEKRLRVVLDLERCTGAWSCWAVCPEGVFEKRPERHQVAIVQPDRCIRCGACLVQCPQDALAFAAPDGRRIEPDTIRRYKLNLLGRRAVAR